MRVWLLVTVTVTAMLVSCASQIGIENQVEVCPASTGETLRFRSLSPILIQQSTSTLSGAAERVSFLSLRPNIDWTRGEYSAAVRLGSGWVLYSPLITSEPASAKFVLCSEWAGDWAFAPAASHDGLLFVGPSDYVATHRGVDTVGEPSEGAGLRREIAEYAASNIAVFRAALGPPDTNIFLIAVAHAPGLSVERVGDVTPNGFMLIRLVDWLSASDFIANQSFKGLITHEVFHYWNGYLESEHDVWLSEGSSEYVALRAVSGDDSEQLRRSLSHHLDRCMESGLNAPSEQVVESEAHYSCGVIMNWALDLLSTQSAVPGIGSYWDMWRYLRQNRDKKDTATALVSDFAPMMVDATFDPSSTDFIVSLLREYGAEIEVDPLSAEEESLGLLMRIVSEYCPTALFGIAHSDHSTELHLGQQCGVIPIANSRVEAVAGVSIEEFNRAAMDAACQANGLVPVELSSVDGAVIEHQFSCPETSEMRTQQYKVINEGVLTVVPILIND